MSLTIEDGHLLYDNNIIYFRLFIEINTGHDKILKFIYDFLNHIPCGIGLHSEQTVEIILWEDDHVDIEIGAIGSNNGTIVRFKYEDCKNVIVKFLLNHVISNSL